MMMQLSSGPKNRLWRRLVSQMALEGDDLCLRWVVHTKEEEEEEEEVRDSTWDFVMKSKMMIIKKNNLAKFGYTLGMKVDKNWT